MSYTGKELAEKYGSTDNIPNEILYSFLRQDDVRADLSKLLLPYTEQLTQSAAAKEKEQKDLFLKKANDKLEEFKNISLVASVRRRCKSDLEWLCCHFTWETNPEGIGRDIIENKITRESHGPILDFFVKKDCSKRVADQDTKKQRLLLWPRGGMKSTIDVVDSVQWILNFPEIRILYLTGDDDLAVGFVDETKGHFVQKTDDPSLMNLFFPEFCVEESKLGNQFEFTCPLWAAKQSKRKEPTVTASSITSSLSGRHYEVLKADDTVTPRNSENEEQCQRISKKISTSAKPGKMLRPFGYFDGVGTRYHEDDWYGEMIEKNVGDLKVTNGKCWTLTENQSDGKLILIAKAIVIKPEVAERLEKEGRQVNYIEAGKDGCDLLFEDVMAYSFLMGSYRDNEETFEAQLNQNPRSAGSTTFDRPLLLRNTVRYEEMPFRGPISQTWDFAGPFNNKKGRDYCTASNGVWNDKGQCFITDLIRNRFKPNDLAKAVVDFAVKWRPFVIGIENAAGARWLEPTIIAEAVKSGDQRVIEVCGRIDWIDPDNQKDAKKLRMAEMHPLLVNGLLKFCNFIPFLPVLYDEFEKCLHSASHDDIPDVISRQKKYAPRVMQMLSKPENANLALLSPDEAWRNMVFFEGDAFGRPGMGGPPLPIIEPEPEAEFGTKEFLPGVVNILGGNW